MGLLRLFSSNSSSIYTNKYGDKIDINEESHPSSRVSYQLGDPQPHRFSVISTRLVNGYTVVKVKYPDCQNFKGNKILVYLGDVVDRVLNADILDPHFLEGSMSPVVRFSPCKNGLAALDKFLKS